MNHVLKKDLRLSILEIKHIIVHICIFVGFYILHKLTSGKTTIFEKENCGIYRDDDGLAIIKDNPETCRNVVLLRKYTYIIFAYLHITNIFLTTEILLVVKPKKNPNFLNMFFKN